MPTLKWPAFTFSASASLSLSTSGEAAFSPCGPWPTIEVGPRVARSTPLTQEAGTSARPGGGSKGGDARPKALVSHVVDLATCFICLLLVLLLAGHLCNRGR